MNAIFPSQRSLTKAAKSSSRRGGFGELLVCFLPAKGPFSGLKASPSAVDTHGSSDEMEDKAGAGRQKDNLVSGGAWASCSTVYEFHRKDAKRFSERRRHLQSF